MLEIDRRNFFKFITTGGAAVMLNPGEALAQTNDPLTDYLNSIQPEKAADQSVIVNNPRYFTSSDLAAFQMYFPSYKAGEISYKVPWELLYIIHKEETTYSTDPNTYSRLYSGAMQRSSVDWPDYLVDQAAKDWPYLAGLPQNYPNDWKEIIWGAKFIRDHANSISADYSSDEEAILNSLYSYSAAGPANRRIGRYRLIKPLFQNNSERL